MYKIQNVSQKYVVCDKIVKVDKLCDYPASVNRPIYYIPKFTANSFLLNPQCSIHQHRRKMANNWRTRDGRENTRIRSEFQFARYVSEFAPEAQKR